MRRRAVQRRGSERAGRLDLDEFVAHALERRKEDVQRVPEFDGALHVLGAAEAHLEPTGRVGVVQYPGARTAEESALSGARELAVARRQRQQLGELSLTRRGERRRDLVLLVLVERVEEPPPPANLSSSAFTNSGCGPSRRCEIAP